MKPLKTAVLCVALVYAPLSQADVVTDVEPVEDVGVDADAVSVGC